MQIRSFLRARPRLFFGICTIVAMGVWPLPFLWEPNGNMAIIPSLATWLSLGLSAGMLVPERPWRWAVAMVIAAPIIGCGLSIIQHRFLENLLMLVVTLPLLPIMAAPIAVAAYAGRYLVVGRAVTEQPSRRAHAAAFLVCATLSAAAMITAWGVWSLVASALAVAVCGAYLAAQEGKSIWRTTVLCVGGGLTGYVAVVIYDSTSGGPNHHMLPFEVWLLLCATVPVAIISAWLGSLWQRRHTSSGVA